MKNTTKKNKTNKEIWIESRISRDDKTRTLTIGSDWGCCTGFKKADCKKLFNAISEAVKTVVPNAVINPWSNSKPGTPDFD